MRWPILFYLATLTLGSLIGGRFGYRMGRVAEFHRWQLEIIRLRQENDGLKATQDHRNCAAAQAQTVAENERLKGELWEAKQFREIVQGEDS